jgi:hypothetical protein
VTGHSDKTHPSARTTKNWAHLYFEAWLASQSEECRRPKIDPRIEWTPESIFKFFEIKDREYNHKLQGVK